MKFKYKNEKKFLLVSCICSALQGLLYLFHGFKTEFSLLECIMCICDLSYIPLVLIFRNKGFKAFVLGMSVVLIFISAFNETRLFNNFSALLCLFVFIMIYPKQKKLLMILYLCLTAVAFVLNEEPMYFYLIHSCRAIWTFSIYDLIIYHQYNRKPLILTDDEQKIIAQLCEGKLQKELELNGYSESTIRRRLASAMKRNDIQTKEELKELYKSIYPADWTLLNTFEHFLNTTPQSNCLIITP